MNLTEYAIEKKTVSFTFVILLIVGGLVSYQKLGKLEFPTFTIKSSVVMTQYPGATPLEVEQEVTDPLETAIQQLAQVDEIRSISKAGMSIIFVDIKDDYLNNEVPQIWDELRRKVSDIQIQLPPGAGPSNVLDDFGDEYGVLFAITGEGYTYEEIKDYADMLKQELLLVKNVASVEIWGGQQEVVYAEISKSRLKALGFSIQDILQTINLQGQVTPSGSVKVGDDYVRLNPTGTIGSVKDMEELVVRSSRSGNLIYLKDVMQIKKGSADPPRWLMRYNGKPALGLGIATVAGGNVVDMGNAVREKIKSLEPKTPVGMEIGNIYYQSDVVTKSIKTFIVNLIEAIAIVNVVLFISMGFYSGAIMGVILLFTILGTFMIMKVMGVSFQIISLGALILSLGMLVDNAIVVTEGILVQVKKGVSKRKAALETVKQTAWPLLGATIVAILAFAAIGTSKDSTGELLKSLFYVTAVSLGLSWILAVTITPLFCVRYLPQQKSNEKEVYGSLFFTGYRKILDTCLRNKVVTCVILVIVLIISFYGFTRIEESFFPNSRTPMFLVDYWKPEGSHIQSTSEDLKKIETFLATFDEVESVATFVGQGALRFILTYEPEMPFSSYGQLMVNVKSHGMITSAIDKLRPYLAENFPEAETKIKRIVNGPSGGSNIEVRFVGEDPEILRKLSEQAKQIMATDNIAVNIHDDWRQKVPVLRPVINDAAARRLGITRPLIADSLSASFSGKTIGLYREDNTLMPIIMRFPKEERKTVETLHDVQVISPVTGGVVPLKQVVSKIESVWEDPIIRRRNRMRTIIAQCDQIAGNASALFYRLRPKIESIDLPAGYTREWGGEYENSNEAKGNLLKMVPIFFMAMVLIVIMLFNAVRQPIIIFLCLPLALIGVTAGLLVTGEPFGFMCILGFLGLSGMLIKNVVVLLDQIDIDIRSGKQRYTAILDASVSRLRPVIMASLTTILGMLPLLKDPFYAGMSITIMSGLAFGTILTLIIAPVLYAMFFRIKNE